MFFTLPAKINDFIIIFLGLVIEALPFILLGVIISNVVHFLIQEKSILKYIPKNRFLALLYASITGFLLPVCECGNVPLARRFVLKGIPPYLAITFLLSAPILNPIVVFSTYAAFRDMPEIFWGRFIFGFLTAYIVGLIMSFAESKEFLQDKVVMQCHQDHREKFSLREFLQNFKGEFAEMMTLMIVGGLIAATVQIFLPRDFITTIGAGPVISILVMLLLAFVVSICSNVDAFFALAYANTFTSGSIIAFLVFGPIIDIKSLLMMSSTFRFRLLIILTVLVAQLVFLWGLLTNFYV